MAFSKGYMADLTSTDIYVALVTCTCRVSTIISMVKSSAIYEAILTTTQHRTLEKNGKSTALTSLFSPGV